MKLKDLNSNYINHIPKFDDLNDKFSGEELYKYFVKRRKVNEIEIFNDVRMHRKFKQFTESKEHHDFFMRMKEDINSLSQSLFELTFPNFEKRHHQTV